MRLFTSYQMRQADEIAAQTGIPLATLMDNAGRAVAEVCQKHFPKAKTFLVLCGKGNNGGDGYVTARYLYQAKKEVVVLEQITHLETLTTEEAREAQARYLELQPCFELGSENLQKALAECDIVIDALLGSGLSRNLNEPLSGLVKIVNNSGKPVVSIDVPSGISSDSPALTGDYIQSTYTIQLAGAKIASAFYPARKAFGSWEVADIGIPQQILESLSDLHILDDTSVQPWLPVREPDVHKYTAGTVLVIAGSSRYLGAAELACRAAYRAGAGLVTLAAEARFSNSWPEIIFEPIDWAVHPLETIKALGEKRAEVRVIGPGLDERSLPFLAELIIQSNAPTVVDAGALVRNESLAKAIRNHGQCVLTPHYGEAAKLLNKSTTDIQHNPLEIAKQLAHEFGATIILKGPTTIVTNGHQCALSLKGHPGMATGGTGDILAGCVGAFLNSRNLFERSAAAVYLHGLAGENAAKHYHYGLVASDLLEYFTNHWQRLS